MTQNAVEAARERLQSQSAQHWLEFGAFVATGNVGTAVLAAGSVVTSSHAYGTKLLLVAMLAASAIAFGLAYFSIQLGCATMVGAVSVPDIVLAFTIAAAQFAMPLWVLRTAKLSRFIGSRELATEALPWCAFAGLFGVAASAANFSASRRRRRQGDLPELAKYESRQRSDRRSALVIGASLLVVCVTVWLISRHTGPLALTALAVAVAGSGMSFAVGFASQTSTAFALEVATKPRTPE